MIDLNLNAAHASVKDLAQQKTRTLEEMGPLPHVDGDLSFELREPLLEPLLVMNPPSEQIAESTDESAYNAWVESQCETDTQNT